MAKKAVKKRFSISRRFDVWVDIDVDANSFEEAVEKRKQLKFSDFLATAPRAVINDYTDLPGGGIYEPW